MRTKYVTIDRGPEYKKTAVSLAVAQDIESRGLGVIGQPVTLKTIKAEHYHIYSDGDYFRHRAQDDLEAKYMTGETFTGVVRWVDASRGDAMITLDDGQELYGNFTAFKGVSKNNYHWLKDEDRANFKAYEGKRVRVKPYITIGYIGSKTVELLGE